jgi:Mg2+ and Co2+ transporter CorA
MLTERTGGRLVVKKHTPIYARKSLNMLTVTKSVLNSTNERPALSCNDRCVALQPVRALCRSLHSSARFVNNVETCKVFSALCILSSRASRNYVQQILLFGLDADADLPFEIIDLSELKVIGQALVCEAPTVSVPPARVVWIDVSDYTANDIEAILAAFSLKDTTLGSIVDERKCRQNAV